MMDFFTIGVYGSTEQEFFNKLIKNNIDTFCDIRQRRGVRGRKYAFVNSKRLQERLESLGIKYLYIKELAPTTEIRNVQKNADMNAGVLKRNRNKLSPAFIQAYQNLILNNFDFNSFFELLNSINAEKVVLFCVEKNPEACHRSIVANELIKLGYKVIHL